MRARIAAVIRRPERKTIWRRSLGVASALALAWFAVTAGGVGASTPAKASGAAVEPAADEAPGYAVEDFNYPEADKILEEQGILLKRGDGHILLAECGATDLLEIYTRTNNKVCFRVTGNTGFLTLEITSVYGVKTNAYDAALDLTTGTEEAHEDIPANTWEGVGEVDDPEGRDYTLVEIRTSK